MTLPLYPTVRGLAFPVMKTSKESTMIQVGPNGTTTLNPQWQNPMWEWTLIYNYLKDNPHDVLPAYSPYTDYRVLQGFYLAQLGQANQFLFNDITDNTVGPNVWVANTSYRIGDIVIDPSGHQQTALRNGITGSTQPSWNDSGGTTNDAGQLWQDGSAISGTLGQTLSLVNDGAGSPTYYTPLQRNFGGQFLEDVTDLNTTANPLRIWANGVLKTGGTCGVGIDYELHGPGLTIPGSSFSGMYIKWCAAPTPPITGSFQFYFRVRFDMDSLDFEQFLYEVWTVGGEDSRNGQGYIKLTSVRTPGV